MFASSCKRGMSHFDTPCSFAVTTMMMKSVTSWVARGSNCPSPNSGVYLGFQVTGRKVRGSGNGSPAVGSRAKLRQGNWGTMSPRAKAFFLYKNMDFFTVGLVNLEFFSGKANLGVVPALTFHFRLSFPYLFVYPFPFFSFSPLLSLKTRTPKFHLEGLGSAVSSPNGVWVKAQRTSSFVHYNFKM